MTATDGSYDSAHDDAHDDAHDEGDDDYNDGHAQNLRIIAGFRAAAQHPDQLAAWLEFGKHNWLWQMVHRKPGRAS